MPWGWGGTSAFRTFGRTREPWLEPEPLPTGAAQAAQMEGLARLGCPRVRIPHTLIRHHTVPISELTPDGLTPSVGHSGSLRSSRRAPEEKAKSTAPTKLGEWSGLGPPFGWLCSRPVRGSERVGRCLPVVPGVSAMSYSENLQPVPARPARWSLRICSVVVRLFPSPTKLAPGARALVLFPPLLLPSFHG